MSLNWDLHMSKHLSKDSKYQTFNWYRSQKQNQENILNIVHGDAIITNKFAINNNQHLLHSHTIIIKLICI